MAETSIYLPQLLHHRRAEIAQLIVEKDNNENL